MKVLALFDKGGKIHALFHPSTDAGAPQLSFHPERGRRAEMLDVPAEFHRLTPAQLHSALRVDLAGGKPRLAAQKNKALTGRKKKQKR
jgi:hypothetical protein